MAAQDLPYAQTEPSFDDPVVRQKVCQRVWFLLNERDRTALRHFYIQTEIAQPLYANEEALNRIVADLQHMILLACDNVEFLKIFWADKMQEAEDAHRAKLNAEV